jgi:RHS repeat-associated protein
VTTLDTGVSSENYQSALPLDFNSDGRMDLLIPNSSGNWRALISQGTTFALDDQVGAGTATVAATGAGGNAILIDYDGDGRQDLVHVVNPGTTNSALRGQRMTATGFSTTVENLYGPSGYYFGDVGASSSAFGSTQNQYRTEFRSGDFNGDGRTDLLARVTQSLSSPVYVWVPMLSNGTSMQLQTDWFMWVPNSEPNVVDINGDGLSDIVFVDLNQTSWYINFATGTDQFVQGGSGVPVGVPSKARFADWDGDGRTDLITNVSGTYYVSRSNGNSFDAPVSLGFGDSTVGANLKVGDIDGDGLPDLVYSQSGAGLHFSVHNGDRADLATAFTDGYGITAQPTYTSIALGAYTKGTGASFPHQDYQGPLYVVNSLVASTGSGGTYTQTYSYEDAEIHLQGRGFMGFGLRRVVDSRDGLYRYDQLRHDFPYTGMVWQSLLKQSNDTTIISQTVNSLQKLDFPSINPTAYFPYVSTATTDLKEVGGTQNGVDSTRHIETVTVDGYGNPTTVTVTELDRDASSPWYNFYYAMSTSHSISNDTTTWCLGRPHQTTVTSFVPGGNDPVRTSSATIDYAQCRVTAQTVEPSSPTLRVDTSFGFDSCGNITSEQVVGRKPDGSMMSARTSSRSYGSRCQLPESATNALEQTTATSYRYDLGLPISVTDPNGLTGSQTYDNFGRSAIQSRPDGTDTTVDLVLCNSANAYCGTGVSDVRWQQQTKQRDTSDAVIRTELIAYDGLDRPRYLATQILGGGYSTVVRTYDTLGRLSREYVPTTGALQGHRQFTYDALGRVLNDGLYTASGTLDRQTTFAYAGRKVTTTDPKGSATERYYDVRGQLRRVVEPSPGGTANYDYEPFGQLASVTDAGGAVTGRTYNLNGHLTALNHPDRGAWSFTPNSLGEMLSQTDAKNQSLTMTYDALSRPLTRTEPEGTTTWTWGSSAAAREIGQLKSVSGFGYAESYDFDALGRPVQTTITADATYVINQDYSATTGLPESLTYPTSTSGYRLRLKYDYDHGVLNKVSDYNQPSTIFWRLHTVDARGHALDESLGTAAPVISVISGYEPLTGLLDYRTVGTGSPYTNRQNLSFDWDLNGNLKKRIDGNQGNLTEEFFYDALDRLDYAARNGTVSLDVAYSANGNISSRSDYAGLGTFSYDPSRPHAVSAVGGSCGSCCGWTDSFSYDANGNQTVRYNNGATSASVSWYSYNLPNSIGQPDGSSAQFYYTPGRGRWKQVANYAGTSETTIYVGGILEKVTLGGTTEYRHYIPAGQSAQAIHTRRSTGTNATYYVTADHLGSGTAVMDANGASLVSLSFAAFGARRGAGWNDVPTSGDWTQITNTSRHGFTGHEMLDSVSAIHMNGRVYDPKLGRFMSADPVWNGNLAEPQSLNPYSYVGNNPLSATDPTGLWSLKKTLKRAVRHVGSAVKHAARRVGYAHRRGLRSFGSVHRRVASRINSNRYGRAITAAVVAYYTAGAASAAYTTAATNAAVASGGYYGALAASSGIATQAAVVGGVAGGAVGGAVATRSVEGAAWGAVTGGAFAGVDVAFSGVYSPGRVLADATVGGASASAQGGDFWQGAGLSATTASAELAYRRIVGYGTDWGPGGPAKDKEALTRPYQGRNNIGTAGRVDTECLFCWSEGGVPSRALNQVYGSNAVSGMHDVFQIGLDEAGAKLGVGSLLRNTLNVPGMPVAAGLTYAALMHGAPSVYVAVDE